MASASRAPEISNALQPLRDVVDSLSRAADGDIPSGAERRKLVRRVRSAGHAALPTLLRAFASEAEAEASWAYYLLARLGGERVVGRLGELLQDGDIADDVKARALALLSDLDAPVPTDVSLRDPEGMLARSVRDLVDSLDRPDELEQAVELIVEQVPEPELPAFAAEVLRHGGRRAAPLLEALAHKPGLTPESERALAELMRHATTAPDPRASQALDRGLAYLEAGRPRAARRRLERFVARHPDHAEGRSALGVCLLELDEAEGALDHLRAAASLQPEEALHRWNLAAAAKQAERMGGAYLALREYLGLTDDGEGADERRKEARSFVRAYERMLRDSHPGVPLSDVLRGEELFARAFAALSEGRAADAQRGFEQVLELVPRHYPSWGNLGAAFLALDQKDEAERCLRRALAINPDYAPAQQNLKLVEEAGDSRAT
jgi:tetratricopeptide (TPR) repeat protein